MTQRRDDRLDFKSSQPSRWGSRFLRAVLTAGAAILGMPACNAELDGLPQVGATREAPCVNGTWQTCGKMLSSEGAQLSCYQGAQLCVEGQWGECQNGQVVTKPKPPAQAPGRGVAALSTVTTCSNNPCDPRCQTWKETPPGGLVAGGGGSGGGTYDWYWCDPASASCTPSVTAPPACAHGLCTTGGGLNPNCDPCVAKICANFPGLGCCDDPSTLPVEGTWTSSCEQKVFSECATTTAPPTDGLCDYGIVAKGTINYGNDNSPGTQSPKGPVAVLGTLTAGNDITFRGIAATGDVTFGHRVTVNGDVNTTGNFTGGQGVHINGNLFVTGDVWFDGAACTVTGSIVAGGTVHFQNTPNSSVGGTIIAPGGLTGPVTYNAAAATPARPAISVPALPSKPVATSATNASQPVVGTLNVAAGTYNSIDVTNNGSLNFTCVGPTCLYQANSIVFGDGGSTLDLKCNWNAGSSKCTAIYDIRAKSTLYFGNNLKLTCSDCPNRTAIDPTCTAGNLCVLDVPRIQWYSDSAALVKVGTPVTNFYGTILAPNATFQSMAAFTGRALVWAGSTFSSEPDNNIDSYGISSECKALFPAGSGAIVQSQCPDLTYQPRRQPCQSGEDCQANASCVDVQTNLTTTATVPACAHVKCSAGSALSSACDPCVARICAVEPKCCNTAWTDGSAGSPDCVGMVKSVCDANCTTTPTTINSTCEHSLCSTGTVMSSSTCDAAVLDCVSKVCGSAEGSHCCAGGTATSWDAACITEVAVRCEGQARPAPPTSGNLCDYAAVATSSFISGSASGVNGGVYAGSNVALSGATFTGNIVANGTVNYGATNVTGTITASGTITGTGTATAKNASVAVPASGINPIVITPNATDAGGCNVSISPGTYRNVTTGGWACTLTMAAGDYNVSMFSVGGGTKVKLPASGTVRIRSQGTVTIDQQSDVVDSSGTVLTVANAGRFQVYSNASINVNGWNARPVGYFAAPNGRITLTHASVLTGLAHAKEIDVQSGTSIQGVGAAGATCKSTTYDQGTNPSGGSVTNLTCNGSNNYASKTSMPNGAGTCSPNGTAAAPGYVDPGAVGLPDLAAGVPCETKLPVCNHGATTAVGTLAVGFWLPTTGRAFTASPLAAWQIAECKLPINVKSGYCQTIDLKDASVTCTGLNPATDLNKEYALRVNSDGAISEFSRLDDWTLFKPGATCSSVCHQSNASGCTSGSGTGAAVYNQHYKAVCPENSGPVWAWLMWDANTPSTSNITFDIRTANAEADLATATFKTLAAKADSSHPICNPATVDGVGVDDPACPVILAAELKPEDGTRLWLELQMTVDPVNAAGAAVKLNNWQITYTCVDNL